ncbi:YeeE/YedE family protein [Acuticoccus sediminis]|uniref:YeeE/YedE family protein n=1 Tax=Acuticoccus sediminis TaxID=2184697 RepID=UPI001CFC59A0|nr:YeeE/YedE family protein [Acuticoccus sediminis]
MAGLEASWLLPAVGVLAGIALGYVARRQRFCTLSALERYWYARDSHPLRTWVLAATVALAATQTLVHTGLIDVSKSMYLEPSFSLPTAALGGLMFGLGMALVGTCGFGAVLRLGGGSLRSLVVLVVIGITALATQRGLVAIARVQLAERTALDLSFAGDQSLGALASAIVGARVDAVVAVVVALAFFAWIFADRSYRVRRGDILTGTAIGLVITFGWVATTFLAARSFDPVQIEAGSFVMPVGETILQFVAQTGTWPDYGIGLVVGTLIGATLAAVQRHDVRWEACDDARELGRHLAGGALMGIGGVLALGCTIGQGISAFSVMAISAPVVMLSIALGARIGLAWLLEGAPFDPIRRSCGLTQE